MLKGGHSKTIIEKSSLDPTVLDNYQPVSNIPFLGKVLEQVEVSQQQGFMDDTDYLDSFRLASGQVTG